MADMMTFPDTVEEFMEQYKVVDTDGVYMSKGSELIPIFRMRQWFEHLPSAQPKHEQSVHSERGKSDKLAPKMGKTWVDVTCPNCGCEIHIKSPAQPESCEITDEQAIEHLQSTGWMQNHDRQMYEMGLKEQLADDSGSYDSLIPNKDCISRQAAIDAFDCTDELIVSGSANAQNVTNYINKVIGKIKALPSARPEIIRCKDCKWFRRWIGTDIEFCDLTEATVFCDDFCSRAERWEE